MTTIPLESINAMNLKQAAKVYCEMEYSLVPLMPGEKKAYLDGWSDDSFVCDETHWDYFPADNIGCKPHASGLMIVDIDNTQAFKDCMESIRPQLCGDDEPFWMSSTAGIVSGAKGKGKLVFALPDGVGELPYHKLNWVGKDKTVSTIFELRCGNHIQDVLPPSIHPKTKKPYKWHNNEILPAPSDLMYLWGGWDEFELQMQKANPDYIEPKPEILKKTKSTKPAVDYLSAWMQMQSLQAWLEKYGYKRVSRNRYLSPHSTSGSAGIVINDSGDKFYSHGQSDPFADGRPHDVYDILTMMEFNGDTKESYKFVLKELGAYEEPEDFRRRKTAEERAAQKQQQQTAVTEQEDAKLPDVAKYFIISKDKRPKVNYVQLKKDAVELMKPVTFNEILYVYQASTGLYHPDQNGKHVRGWIDGIFDAATNCDAMGIPESDTQAEKAKTVLVSYLSSYNVVLGEDSPFNMFDGVPVKNGVLQFDSEGNVSMMPYSAEQMFTWQIDTNYNPDVDTTRIKEIIDSWVDEENRLVCIEPLAQAIVQSLPSMQNIRKSWLLVGDRRGGKTTYTNLLKRTVGEKNTAGVNLQDLDKPFKTASLENKVMNIVEELPRVGVEGGQTFMSVVSNKRQMIERKYQQPYNTHIHCVHLFASNKPPALSQELQEEPAWWDRWRMHAFTHTHDNVPNWEQENFTKENIEAFFLLAVKVAGEIIRNRGKLLYQQEPEEVMEAWLTTSDPISRFLKENFITGNPGDWVLKVDVLKAVRAFRETVTDPIEKILVPTEMNSLTTKLKSKGVVTSQIRNPENSEERLWVYKGLKWKYDAPDAEKK